MEDVSVSTCCGPGQCRGWRGPDLSGDVKAWASWSGSGELRSRPASVAFHFAFFLDLLLLHPLRKVSP